MIWIASLLSLFLFFPHAYSVDYLKTFRTEKAFVQTQEDHRRLGFYSALGEQAEEQQFFAQTIPKTFHFIWLGPKPLPSDSIKNIQGWIRRHPDWKFKFWTDVQKEILGLKVEFHFFEDFPLKRLEEIYFDCDNFGERSLLLRYAILLSEGGVYVDHDVECLKRIDPLQEKHDFFCGLERLGPSVLSSSVNPSPHLIGAAGGHPILHATLQWLQKEWERLRTQYPGGDPSAVFNRVQHRAFRALGLGIQKEHHREGRSDVVFPPQYFSLSHPSSARYAVHRHLGTWNTNVTEVEMKVKRLFSEVTEELSQSFLVILALTLVNLLVGGTLWYRLKKPRGAT